MRDHHQDEARMATALRRSICSAGCSRGQTYRLEMGAALARVAALPGGHASVACPCSTSAVTGGCHA